MSGRGDRAVGVNFAMFVTLTVLISITPYSIDAALPGLPSAVDELGVSPSTMQLSISTFLVGVAVGQLVFGPLSDRLGRRMPLIVGVAVAAAAAVVAALAPGAEVLIAARLVQGLAASAASALGKAITRDRTSGRETTDVLAMTAVGAGVLNLISPVIGGQLAQAFGWRGPLWFIAGYSVLVLVIVVVTLPETHLAENRDRTTRLLGLPSILRHLRNRPFMFWVLVQAGSFGALMAYVASSAFVYQNVLGFDAATYGMLFAVNLACGVVCNFVANRFLRHLGSRRLVALGLSLSMVGTVLVALGVVLGAPAGVTAAFMTLSMAPIMLNGPNLVGLALNEVTRWTGSAAAVIGFVQFLSGAIVSPFVGLWGTATIVPMVATMAALSGLSLVVLGVSSARRRRLPPVAEPTG